MGASAGHVDVRKAPASQARGQEGTVTVDLQALAGRRNDERARAQLEGCIHQIVQRYCRALLGRSGEGFGAADQLADELVGTILREHIHEFEGPAPAEAVVYAGMAPVVARALESRPAPTPRPHLAGAASPEDVHDQLGRLPPRFREVLVLRAFVGMTSEQVGRALGLPPQAVLQQQRRALAWLRAL
jgi:RNA polymerase sigma-70 factor (ECF subfamily)